VSKFKVGDEVVLVSPSYRSGPATTDTRTIAKVGRKYAYLTGSEWWIAKMPFDLETGIESGEGNYPHRIYTPQDYKDSQRRAKVLEAIKEHGIRWEFGGGQHKMSLAKLEKLLAVLEEKD
jgi:hypothetical protein